MSNCKCSYCEVKLGEEGKFMQVDHYHHKKKYPDEVVQWDNLIPSCNRCNSNKSIHDTYKEPIVNPYVDDPRDYLYMENYRIKSRNKLGQTTIDVLYLNDTEGLVLPRFKIGDTVQKKIEEIKDTISDYREDQSVKKRNKLVNTVKDLLKEARKDSEYSALVATVLIQDDTYLKVKDDMKELALWDEEMDLLHNNAIEIALLK